MSSETPSHFYWVGGALGAVTLASASAAIMWVAEKKIPTIKTVGRDFILGAILFFLLLQLLPDSTMSLVAGVLAFVTVNSETLDGGSTSNANSIIESAVSAADDIELRVGVPNF
jgi:hypothetical protein